jgi:hypothetical protein
LRGSWRYTYILIVTLQKRSSFFFRLRDLRLNGRAKAKDEEEMSRITAENPRLLMQTPLSASAASSWFDIGGSAAGNLSPESQHHTLISFSLTGHGFTGAEEPHIIALSNQSSKFR